MHDVLQGGESDFIGHVAVDVDFCTQFLAAHEFCDRAMEVFCHLLHDGIALRMDGAVVERLLAAVHTQESGCLFKGFRSQFGHFQQVFS